MKPKLEPLFSARVLLWVLLGCTLLFLFAACGLMSPAQQGTALQVIDQMLVQGTITPEQHEGLRQAILQSGMMSWLQQAGTILGGAVLAWWGTRSNLPIIGRGAPTQRVGLPEGKVRRGA